MTADLPIVLPLTAPLAHRGYSPDLSGQGGGAPRGYSYLIDKNGVVMLDARGNALLMRVRND